MKSYRCPACKRRIAGDRRCFRCGWRRMAGGDAPIEAPRPWGRITAVLALVLMLGAVGVYRMNGAAIADWYAEFAMRHLPAGFSSFGPADTPSGAFYHCVSRVAKEVSDGSTVETFPSYTEANTRALGSGRYAVRAALEGTGADGERMSRSFTCEVRFERGRWVTERLAVGDRSPLPAAALRL